MPAGTDWNSTETWQRLVAAIIASGVKVDLKATAKYYGCTYDTLENRFRKIKKDAAVLKEEGDGDNIVVAAPTRAKSAPTTPKKSKTPKKDALQAVANGRVTKTGTPSSNKKKAPKQETSSGDEYYSLGDDAPSFGQHDVDFGGHSIFGDAGASTDMNFGM